MTEFLDSIDYSQWILHALILLPLAGVVPVLLGRRAIRQADGAGRHPARVRAVARPLVGVRPSDGGMQLVSSTPWIPRWGISYRVGIDGISLFMVLLTTAHDAAQRAGKLAPTSPGGSAAFYALMLRC